MKTVAIVALLLFSLEVFAASSGGTSRHHGGGIIGPNGVKQRVALKIMKDGTAGKDMVSLQLDLGDHKYSSTKPEAWINPNPDAASGVHYEPVITLTLGALTPLQATSDAKGKLSGDFTGKLVDKGAGIRIDVKKATLAALVSELSGKGAHGLLSIKLQKNHPPSASAASASADSRHPAALFEAVFELTISENTKKLTGKS